MIDAHAKKPDMDGFRTAMKSAAPGKKHQNAAVLMEALEIVTEARARGVPWATIAEGLKSFGINVTVAHLKKVMSERNKRVSPERLGTSHESDLVQKVQVASGTAAAGGEHE